METVVRWEEVQRKRLSPEQQRRRREVTEMVAHWMDESPRRGAPLDDVLGFLVGLASI